MPPRSDLRSARRHLREAALALADDYAGTRQHLIGLAETFERLIGMDEVRAAATRDLDAELDAEMPYNTSVPPHPLSTGALVAAALEGDLSALSPRERAAAAQVRRAVREKFGSGPSTPEPNDGWHGVNPDVPLRPRHGSGEC